MKAKLKEPFNEGLLVLSSENNSLKESEEKIKKANRLYEFISQVNRNILRVRDEATLFRNICNIVQELGNFKMVWLGLFDETSKTFSLTCQQGIPSVKLRLFSEKASNDTGPQFYVLNTGSDFICNDIANNLELEDWKLFAEEIGIHSMMVLPVKRSGNIIGTLNIYAAELKFSNKEEIRLLKELINNISFALDSFEKERLQKKAEEKLKQNESRLKEAQAISHTSNWEIDFTTNIHTWSDELYHIFGINKEEEKPCTELFLSFVHPDDAGLIKKKVYEAFNSLKATSYNFRFIRKDGAMRYGYTERKFEFDNKNKPVRLIGVVQDVTEIKLAENAIKESNERYELASKATNDILWDWDILTDNIYRSDNYHEQFGYRSSSRDVYKDDAWISNIYFEDRERTMATMLEKVNSPDATIWEEEYRFYRNNGELRFIKDKGHIVRDENGKAVRMVGAMTDITKQKFSEAELLQEQKKLKEAQAIAHIGSWQLNFASNILTLSDEACSIYGIPLEENKQSYESWLSFIHPEDLDNVLRAINESQKTLSDTVLNHRILLKDGTIKHIYSKSKFELDQNGKPLGLSGIAHDVTDRKVSEAEREKMIADIIQRNKVLQQFAQIVSHNLRGPITTILGISEVLKIKVTEEERKETQQYLFDAVRQLDKIIKDLNRILQTRLEVNEYKVPVSFPELVSDIKSSIQDLIEKENVQIMLDFSAVDSVTTLKSYVHNIFYNLITNSIKFRQPGNPPFIRIKSEINKDKIILHFKDNGLGINLKQSGNSIFGLYRRFHPHIEGKGLGLFMVRTQVEVLGGSIHVKSKPNTGSEFIIELPL